MHAGKGFQPPLRDVVMHFASTVTSKDAVKNNMFVAKILTLKCRKITESTHLRSQRRIFDLF
jgi:S-adenosylmethionine:diacylglycerol 3-amino-3-carboxypropyl transferase